MNMNIQTGPLIEDGFQRLESAFSAEEISRFRSTLDTYIAGAGVETGIGFEDIRGESKAFAIDQLFNKGGNEFLSLLTHPVIAGLIAGAVGGDFLISQEFVVIKNRHSPNEVGWHQDIVTDSALSGYMIGIYLDDADANEGCLRIIPGSHVSGEHMCELQKKECIAVPMKAGDVLIHDLKLAHSSGVLTHHPIRRVVYVEVLPMELVTTAGLYNAAFVAARSRLPELAGRRETECVKEQITELYRVTAPMKPANYCFP